jgi:hypothetical protein
MCKDQQPLDISKYLYAPNLCKLIAPSLFTVLGGVYLNVYITDLASDLSTWHLLRVH